MTCRRGRALRGIAALACAAAVLAPQQLAVAGPRAASDAATARAQARAAADHVAQVRARLVRAQRDYTGALGQVGQQVSDYLLADGERAAADRAASDAAARSDGTVRALYLSGGQAGLLNSVLSSGDFADLAVRISGVRQVLSSASEATTLAQRTAARAAQVADRHRRAADASVVTAAQLTERADRVSALLDDAQRTLDRLSARARSLTEAEQAAAALAAARAAAAAAQAQAIGQVQASEVPADYFALYRSAARTCPGMSWTLLAAVGQVESGHGRNAGVSSAGAVGPMQFMPGTFAAYAVDGDHDGRADPYSPADAVFTAARYLCAGGAGRPDGVQAALFRYNRAQWYVDLVLAVQQHLEQDPNDAPKG